MDFFVVLTRKGYRTSRKKYKRGRIGVHHKISKEDAQQWFLDNFQDAHIKNE